MIVFWYKEKPETPCPLNLSHEPRLRPLDRAAFPGPVESVCTPNPCSAVGAVQGACPRGHAVLPAPQLLARNASLPPQTKAAFC